MTKSIDADEFKLEIEKILNRVNTGAGNQARNAVAKGVKKSASFWRSNASEHWKARHHTYRKHGKVHETGKYVKSIRSHMTSNSAEHPSGEVGAPKMPGLPHLLEFGHAKVGGGRVKAIPHIASAAKKGFNYTIEQLELGIEMMLDDV